MLSLDENHARCEVYVFKKGLLRALGHDLRLRVAEFRLQFDEDQSVIVGTFKAKSLRVEEAMYDGHVVPGALSEGDRIKIEQTIRREVLQASVHPEIRVDLRAEAMEMTDDAGQADGEFTGRGTAMLQLRGTRAPVAIVVRHGEGETRCSCEFKQSDFGIRPYSAALGALRIKDVVRMELTCAGVPDSFFGWLRRVDRK